MESAVLKTPQNPVRVMLVDDVALIRNLVAKALTPDPTIQVVATAANGAAAIPLAAQCKPDIIVLDIEMPEMDGITALPKLLAAAPGVRIIMASTLTQRNASISLQALSLGACDYVAKPSAQSAELLTAFYRELREKIKALGGVGRSCATAPPVALITKSATSSTPVPKTAAIAIASSTGGPQALTTLLDGLKGRFMDIPIFVTQHMPPVFTKLLAESLTKIGGRPCHECKEGTAVQPGHIYLAPGDFHMVAEKRGEAIMLHINQNPPENFCRPSADPMLRSLRAVYGSNLLALVLTGMGSDGLEGAKTVVAGGGQIIAQDEASSIVWGMPRAVAEHGLCRAVLPLTEIAPYLISGCRS